VFTAMIAEGFVPAEFKRARVTALFKSGNRTDPENYRPISVGSLFSLILEKIVCHRIANYLETNFILSSQQFGFRRGSCTSHAVLQLVSAVQQDYSTGCSTAIAFVDIKDAFPSVDHAILLQKVEHYGIGGSVLQWLKGFVENRCMFVSVNGFDSDPVTVTRCVPQGSSLGPLLFLIYFNDIAHAVSSRFILFADDTALLCSGATVEEAAVHLSEAMGS
jgi:hypothetical protein